jgi:putative selenate reductase
MRPIPFSELINWVRGEYKNHGSVFGVRKEKFYRPAGTNREASFAGRGSTGAHSGTTIFGARIGSPIGPAAGPNSQLAQNILASYLAGSRFVEVKTVQTMDGEEPRKTAARPCINALDEGYNVERSAELTADEALEEYVKAWFLCHVFAQEFALANSEFGLAEARAHSEFGLADAGDFIFNMSVGCGLEEIKSQKMDSYIEGMKNARETAIWKSCYQYLTEHIDLFDRFNLKDLEAISPVISSGATLSTLYGGPREEIEKIAAYLITEKGLHTWVKCNPTLLGYTSARSLLDKAGYNYISFDDHHFKNDPQFSGAVEMLSALMKRAKERNLSFGVKLTNTLPVRIKRNELPGGEMYMSGRALFHLSVNVAKRLSAAFNGELPISYSGGVDLFNLKEILETGIKPVTVATTILKPGGYERLCQLAELAEKAEVPAEGFINVKALSALADGAAE